MNFNKPIQMKTLKEELLNRIRKSETDSINLIKIDAFETRSIKNSKVQEHINDVRNKASKETDLLLIIVSLRTKS